MATYDHRAIEAKWQRIWSETKVFRTPTDKSKPKYYVLDMFPYPSGSGLHVGHPKGYVATDVVARARRMMGYHVLRVMGWDAFGLPTERQAEREGKHPREITQRNIETFKRQLNRLGLCYDWDRELATSDTTYYRWTQWIFLQLYHKGLAYQAQVPVNWCPALGTVLANEEVQDGVYIETGDPVERRTMTQWMLRITRYAESLLAGLNDLDWPQGIKDMQRAWIGRSEGAQVQFALQDHPHTLQVFTTRPDTLFGCTYVVLAPEHPLVEAITKASHRQAVNAYCEQASRRSERERTAQAADAPKTGCFTGAYCLHPVTGATLPIWISDYVLASYGTGAVFACPAHDARDHAFANTFDLPIVEVVQGGQVSKEAYLGDGPHINSQFLDGLTTAQAKRAIIAWLESHQLGKGTVQYRLRDWLFSRQRYWGEPFPVVSFADGTVKPLPPSALPVELPQLAELKPTPDGRPPLARATDWVHYTDPETGLPALRETNTMPQWAGSCWYYLRYLSPHNQQAAWDPTEEAYWMPVDLYVGGAEHAVLHLLYARFWHHVLHDLGLVGTREPFTRLFNQGMVHKLAFNASADMRGKFYYPHQVQAYRGGAPIAESESTEHDEYRLKGTDQPVFSKIMKMSKSRYNVVNPDDICTEYGADALRLYELFMGPLDASAMWETHGVAGTKRFLDRAWRLVCGEAAQVVTTPLMQPTVERALHQAIKKVTEAIHSLKFNTAISEMMVFVNEATKAERVHQDWLDAFVRILAPFAPHMAEELWSSVLRRGGSIAEASWPSWNEAKLAADTLTLAVQVNGKLRGTIEIPVETPEQAIIARATDHPQVAKHLRDKSVKRSIYVPGRLVNLVAR